HPLKLLGIADGLTLNQDLTGEEERVVSHLVQCLIAHFLHFHFQTELLLHQLLNLSLRDLRQFRVGSVQVRLGWGSSPTSREWERVGSQALNQVANDICEYHGNDCAAPGAGRPAVLYDTKRDPEDGDEYRSGYEITIHVVEIEFLDHGSTRSARAMLHF